MKNLSIKFIVLTLTLVLFSTSSFTAVSVFGLLNQESDVVLNNNIVYSQEELDLIIIVNDKNGNSNSMIYFEVVSSVGFDNLGFYSLYDGDTLTLNVSHTNWTINIIENDNDADLIHYYQN